MRVGAAASAPAALRGVCWWMWSWGGGIVLNGRPVGAGGLPQHRSNPKPNPFGTDHRSPRLKDLNLLLRWNLKVLLCDSCGCLGAQEKARVYF